VRRIIPEFRKRRKARTMRRERGESEAMWLWAIDIAERMMDWERN